MVSVYLYALFGLQHTVVFFWLPPFSRREKLLEKKESMQIGQRHNGIAGKHSEALRRA